MLLVLCLNVDYRRCFDQLDPKVVDVNHDRRRRCNAFHCPYCSIITSSKH